MKPSQKYLKGRIDKGIAEGSKNEYFILDKTVEKVATMYSEEQMKSAIHKINQGSCINGVKGLCSKSDVIAILLEVANKKFEIPAELYPTK